MFEVHTTDTERLKRIAATGGAGIVLGLFMMLFNFVVPFFSPTGYDVAGDTPDLPGGRKARSGRDVTPHSCCCACKEVNP